MRKKYSKKSIKKNFIKECNPYLDYISPWQIIEENQDNLSPVIVTYRKQILNSYARARNRQNYIKNSGSMKKSKQKMQKSQEFAKQIDKIQKIFNQNPNLNKFTQIIPKYCGRLKKIQVHVNSQQVFINRFNQIRQGSCKTVTNIINLNYQNLEKRPKSTNPNRYYGRIYKNNRMKSADYKQNKQKNKQLTENQKIFINKKEDKFMITQLYKKINQKSKTQPTQIYQQNNPMKITNGPRFYTSFLKQRSKNKFRPSSSDII